MRGMKRLIALIVFLCVLVPQRAFLMESTNFKVLWDSLNTGGDDSGVSANYSLHDTAGEAGTGVGTSENFQVSSGYRAAEAATDVLTLTIRAQETSTQVTSTAFNATGPTVTVSAAGAFTVGDYIGAVENKGFSQKVATGRITGISGTMLTVDSWSGDQSSMSASPSGGDDFVYRLGGSTVSFGTVYQDSQQTVVAMTSVASTASAGYTVYAQTNQLLRSSAGGTIPATSDGVVTAGGDEYGAHVTGATGLNTTIDVGIDTTQRAIQSSSGVSTSTGDRIGMTYKLTVTNVTGLGDYSQNIFYTLTANY